MNDRLAINIIIDNTDSQNPVFVEIETEEGKSIRIGTESTDENGYRKLRISAEDLIAHEAL